MQGVPGVVVGAVDVVADVAEVVAAEALGKLVAPVLVCVAVAAVAVEVEVDLVEAVADATNVGVPDVDSWGFASFMSLSSR
jgi:hypothetical protein